jgi:hypothetical protein
MKRLARLAVCGLMLAASTGCCHMWGGGCGAPCGGCNSGCGYGGGMYGPTGYATGAQMSAGLPIIAPTTTTASLNPLPTY